MIHLFPPLRSNTDPKSQGLAQELVGNGHDVTSKAQFYNSRALCEVYPPENVEKWKDNGAF